MADTGEQNGGEHKGQDRAGARPSRPVSRRRVLSWSLAGIAGAGLAAEGIGGLVSLARTAAASQGTAIWASLTRPQDQLDLRWELLNVVRYKAGEGPGDTSTARIAVADGSQPAFLVVHFPPQNVAERAYFAVDPNLPGQQGDETAQMAAPVPSMLAGETRLAFRLLPGADPIPFTPEGLLNWTGLVLSVVPAAARTINGRPGPQAPVTSQTSIEAPWGLMLSPDDGAGWAHSLTPVTHGGRTELWHTRLGVRQNGGIDEADATHRTVRAVWTPGYQAAPVPTTGDTGPNPPGRTSLDPRTRYQIVRLSSDHSMDTVVARQVTPYQPRPIAVNRLMLSTLGAWVDTDGSWDVPMRPTNADVTFDVEEWLHKATMGRDNYVKVVVAGFLFPFGHRASYVTITERAFEPVRDASHPTSPPLAAVNRQRIFVVVREPERTYPGYLPNQPHGGRAMPWKKVRITTVSTPPLAGVEGTTTEPLTRIAADPSYGQPYFGSDAFWPVVPSAQGPQDFLFALEGEDAEGRRSQFTAPLVFVRGSISDDADHTKKIVDEYMAPAAAARRQRSLGGQRVTLTSLPGKSTYPVDSVTLGAEQPDPPNADLDYRHQPRFFPVLTGAGVRLDAVEQVSGKPAGSGPAQIAWYAPYLKGTDLNPGQLFATLPNPIDLGFPADALGALATPDLRIGGLSSLTGIVGGSLPTVPPLGFDPAAFFAGAAPKILGALPLTAILDGIGFDLPDQLPQLLKAELPDKITTSYTWRPKIKADGDTIFDPGQTGALTIRATATVRRSGGAPSFEIVGELTNFKLNAFGIKDFGMLTLNFRKLRFSARDGLKATVDADLSGVTFHGVLEFINPLQDFLAKLGVVPPRQSAAATQLNPGKAMAGKALAKTAASDPPPNGPDISVTAAGIRAGYTLAVPTVSVGVFSLENIVLSSVLNIPFLGDPARVRFAFADRERPFLLTVAMFGGGGFCALQLGLDGFERFEAALEFGAKLGLDLGVASGGVSVMAGIYFALGKTEGELSGYVRINGELRILGLISLGLEFYLGMTYETSTGEVSGQARLTVSIDIAFFSTSVTLGPIEKRFGGGTKVPPGGNAAMAAHGKTAARALAASPYAPPPGLADLMSQADWADPTAGYCAMFAPTAFA